MNWTKTKPTKDGWYWYRMYKFKNNSICEVRDGVVRWAFSLRDNFVEKLEGEWWGPLREPDLSPDGKTYNCLDADPPSIPALEPIRGLLDTSGKCPPRPIVDNFNGEHDY